MQRFSLKGAAFLTVLEGKRNVPYYDSAGILTVGVGFAAHSASFQEWFRINEPGKVFDRSYRMSDEKIADCLQFIVNREYGAAVAKFLGHDVTQHIFDGMTSAVFNMGTGSLKWKWAQAVKDNNPDGIAYNLNRVGVTAVGSNRKLPGLVKRRQEEVELIIEGDYSIAGRNMPAEAMADGVLRRRERGTEVHALQVKLRDLGLYDGELDGIFGFGTEAAVLDFQRMHGLTADGLAGPTTLVKLAAEWKKPQEPDWYKPVPNEPPVHTEPVKESGGFWDWFWGLFFGRKG